MTRGQWTALVLVCLGVTGCSGIPVTYGSGDQAKNCTLTFSFKVACPTTAVTPDPSKPIPSEPIPGYRRLDPSLFAAYWASAGGLDGTGFAKATRGYANAAAQSEFAAHDYLKSTAPKLQAEIDDARQHSKVYVAGLVYLTKYKFDSHVYPLDLEETTPVAVDIAGDAGVVIQNYRDFPGMQLDETAAAGLRAKLVQPNGQLMPLVVVWYGQPQGTGTFVSSGDLMEAWRTSARFGGGVVGSPGLQSANAIALHATEADIYLPDGTPIGMLKAVRH